MMFSAPTIAAAAAILAGAAFALPAPAVDSSSTAFGLAVTSLTSHKYNETAVGACHSGAAIEALCVDGFASPFTFNATDSPPKYSGDTNGGYLQFTIGTDVERMVFKSNDSSNVYAAFFGPAGGYVSGPFLVDFTAPPAEEMFLYGETETNADYVYWYVCPQTTQAYQYETISFINPTVGPVPAECDAISIRRTYPAPN